MIVQCYFSVAIEPVPSRQSLDELYAITAGNLTYPIGVPADGRMLCRALVEDDRIAATALALAAAGKLPVICGVFAADGSPVAGFDANKSERERFFQPIPITDPETGDSSLLIPADNTAAGWQPGHWDSLPD
jgi:hypothetical protein